MPTSCHIAGCKSTAPYALEEQLADDIDDLHEVFRCVVRSEGIAWGQRTGPCQRARLVTHDFLLHSCV